jgi:hypothetical protein
MFVVAKCEKVHAKRQDRFKIGLNLEFNVLSSNGSVLLAMKHKFK